MRHIILLLAFGMVLGGGCILQSDDGYDKTTEPVDHEIEIETHMRSPEEAEEYTITEDKYQDPTNQLQYSSYSEDLLKFNARSFCLDALNTLCKSKNESIAVLNVEFLHPVESCM